MTLICLGSFIFTILSIRIGGDANAARIAAPIVSGVGFFGAGVIVRDDGRVTGLTTAATALTGGVLLLFPFVEHQIDRCRESIDYTVTCASSGDLVVWSAAMTLTRG